MYYLERSIRRHAVGCAGLLCLLLVVASASRCTNDSITGGENPVPEKPAPANPTPMGTIHGSVTADGSPIFGVEVWIASPRTSATTDAEGAFTFTLPAGGPYVVQLSSASVPATTCDSASAIVEPDQSVTVHIVCQPIGMMTGVVRWSDGSFAYGAQIALSGPVGRQSQASRQGQFRFSELPPGDYTVTPNAGCPSVSATVHVGQVTSVEVACEVPTFTEIGGDWAISIPRGGGNPWDYGDEELTYQTGSCPSLLAVEGRGAIAFDAAANKVSIVGLDPELTIVGWLDPAICVGAESCTRAFSGAGMAVRLDGSFIRSKLTGSFHFSILDGGFSFSSPQGFSREHRVAGGELVCSEIYSPNATKLGG